VTDDGTLSGHQASASGTDPRNRFYYLDLSKPGFEVVKLHDDFDADYSFIDNVGTDLLFLTNQNAPKYRVIAVDIHASRSVRTGTRSCRRPSRSSRVCPAWANQFFCEYLQDARSVVKAHDLEGKLGARGGAARHRQRGRLRR